MRVDSFIHKCLLYCYDLLVRKLVGLVADGRSQG